MTVGKPGSTDTKRWVWLGLAVVALGAVIFLGGALSGPESGPPAPSRLAPAARSAKLTRDAKTALSRNDTPTALNLANEAISTDPDNADARAVIKRAEASAEPQDDGTGDKDAPPRDDSAYLEAVDDLATLLPAKIAGWEAGQTVGIEPDVLVTYQPQRGSDADSMTERAVFSVHDMETPQKAEKFVSGVSKVAYPDDASTLVVNSIGDAYFGTNSTGAAVVAFSRGRFAFELLLVAEQAVDPATLEGTAQQLSAAFPATQ